MSEWFEYVDNNRMLGNGLIAKNQYEWLTFTIKTEMDGWLEELDDYNHNDSKSKCLGG